MILSKKNLLLALVAVLAVHLFAAPLFAAPPVPEEGAQDVVLLLTDEPAATTAETEGCAKATADVLVLDPAPQTVASYGECSQWTCYGYPYRLNAAGCCVPLKEPFPCPRYCF